jgi:hypothetical protein
MQLNGGGVGFLTPLRAKLQRDLAAQSTNDVEEVLRYANRVAAVDSALDVVERRLIAAAADKARKLADEKRCHEKVWSGSWRSGSRSRCKFKGIVQEDKGDTVKRGGEWVKTGPQWFCKIHSAKGKREREERERAKYRDKEDERIRRSRLTRWYESAGYMFMDLMKEVGPVIEHPVFDPKKFPVYAKAKELRDRYGK